MNCYLCDCEEFRQRKGTVRDDHALRILECVECGLVRLSSFEHISIGHYENAGMHGRTPPAIETMLRGSEKDDQRRFEMLKPIITNRRVMDFGCGGAGFLGKARSVAAEVAGVEPEARVREYWRSEFELHANLETSGTGYDVITAFHVIEHLVDPRATLSELAQHLAPGGRIVIEVPSSEDALLTLYDCEAFQRFTYWSQHLYLFNAETLRRLVKQAGLNAISIEQFQRYPPSNHLYWLSRGEPGGHERWAFLDTPALASAYGGALAAIGKCDTLIANLSVPPRVEEAGPAARIEN